MTTRIAFSLSFLLFPFVNWSQKVQFINAQDSTVVQKLNAHALDEEEKVIFELKSNEKGIIDFSPVTNGLNIEVYASGFEVRTFSKVDQMPKIITLHPISKRMEEFVLTGQMQQTYIGDAIQTVRIISAKRIEQMGAQNLTQLFSNELNIQLSNDPILGSSLSLQGISGENIKLLIDGVPIIGRLNGSVDLDQININNVERIEIIEGPLSVNYGSDALAGTINIITKTNKNARYTARLKGHYESSGTYNTQFDTSTSFKKTSLGIDINRNFFDGWRPNESPFHMETEGIADENRNKLFKPREQIFGGVKWTQRLNDSKHSEALTLSVNTRGFNEKIENRGTPLAPYGIRAMDETYKTLRLDNSISLTGRIAKKWSINSVNSYNYFRRRKNTFINDLTRIELTPSQSVSDHDTSVFDLFLSRTSFIYKHSQKFQYEVGYDINYESSRGMRIENEVKSMGDYAIFTTAEYSPWKKFTIKPGLRASYNSVYNSPVIPSIFFKYQITKNNGIRLSYSRGFRAPSLKELYFYFVDINHNIQGNSNLEAETSNNFQLALRTEYEKGKCRFVWTNQLYYNDLSNLITLAQLEGTEYGYVNMERSQNYGFNSNVNFSRKNFLVDAGITVKARRSQFDRESEFLNGGFYTEFKVNPSYHFPRANTTVNVFYKFTGKMPNFVFDADGNVTENRRQSYSMLDLTATTKFWKERVGLTLGVKNLFNVTSIQGTSSGGAHESGGTSISIGMGRTYFASLTFQFKQTTKSK